MCEGKGLSISRTDNANICVTVAVDEHYTEIHMHIVRPGSYALEPVVNVIFIVSMHVKPGEDTSSVTVNSPLSSCLSEWESVLEWVLSLVNNITP